MDFSRLSTADKQKLAASMVQPKRCGGCDWENGILVYSRTRRPCLGINGEVIRAERLIDGFVPRAT
jgi:hypothetical protein